MDERINITKISVELTQKGNTIGTTDDYEYFVIDVENVDASEKIEDNGFLVIRTEGWSIDSPDELNSILTAVQASAASIREAVNSKDMSQ
jgi:hypothetical protein